MKNRFLFTAVSLVLFLAVLGCSRLNPFSDSSKPANTQAVEHADRQYPG